MPDVSRIALTPEQLGELVAIEATTDELSGPTNLHKEHYRSHAVGGLIRRRLVTWDKGHPRLWDPEFRAVELTDTGRRVLAAYRDALNPDPVEES